MAQKQHQNSAPSQAAFDASDDILMNAPIGIFTSTPEGRFISANSALARMYGYGSPEELIASITDITTQLYVEPEDRKEFIRLLDEDCEVTNHESRFRRKDGTVFWVSRNARVVKDKDGAIVAYQGFTTDITDRKRAEEALRNSDYEKTLILDNTNEIIAYHDTERRIVWANNTYLRGISGVFGTLPALEDVKGKKCFEAWGLNLGCRDCPVALAIKTGVPQQGELTPDNQEHWPQTQGFWAINAAPVRNAEGLVIGAIEIAQDITERKRAEEEMRSQAALIIALLDSIPDIILIKDTQGVYLGCNSEFARHVGHRKEDIIGKTDYDLYSKEEADFFRENDRRMLELGKPRHNEEWISYPDGRNILLDTIKTPCRDAEGNVLGVIGICRDITIQKQAEVALQESEEKHRRLFETMTQGVVYHAADGSIVSANPAAERIIGLTFDQMRGKTPVNTRWRLIKEDGSEISRADHPTMMALHTGKSVGPVTLRLFNPDKNDHIWLSITAIPLFQPGETKPFQVYATFEDITERKRMEEALRKSESLFRKVFEILPIGLWIADKNGKLLQGNPAGVAIWGTEPSVDQKKYGVFKAKRLPSGEKITPDDWALAHTVNKGETIVDELLEIDAFDGKKKIILNYTSPVLDGEGNVEAAIVVNQDITERKRAEEALRKSGALLAETESIGKVGGWSFNIDTMEQKWTDEVYRIHEVEIAPNPCVEAGINYYTKESRPIIEKAVQRAIEHGENFDLKLEIITAKGNTRAVHTIGKADLKNRRVYGFFQDITDRKQAEDGLRESEERFKALHNASFGGIAIHDKGIILECNLGLSEISGFDYNELIGMNGLLLIAEQSRELVMSNILSGYEKPYEAFGVRKNGEEYPLRLEARNIPYKGKMVRVVEFRDITEHKQSELALLESESRFRNLFEHVPTVAVQGYGMDGIALFWNKASERFYGFSSNEALGKHLVDLIIPDEMRQAVLREIKTMYESGSPMPAAELQLKRKDGSYIQVYSSHAMIQRPGHEPELFCIDIDMTELKETEQALLTAKEQAEAANKSKSEFLANMSHEIRTPINGIMGMMQLLEMTSLDGDQRKYVQMATSSANRLTRLLSDILDLSRVEAGMMTIHEAEFVVQELADSVSDLFQVVTRDKDIQLECFIDPDIPTRLIGDEARVRQILFNLTGNALKFTDKGSVKVGMTAMSSERPSECRILLTVSDTGIGIPEDKQDDLFKPFVQVDGTYTRSYQGAGLGLAIVKRLADLMGGKISLASTLGEGTTVQVLLPFKLPEGASIAFEQGPRRLTEARQSLRILLAEDEPSSSFPTAKLLEKAGHTVTLAEDGQQALDLLAAQDFDVILMDVQMPVLDGVEATKRIRSQESEVSGQKSDVGDWTSGPQVSGLIPQPSQHSSIPASQNPRIPIIALTAYAMLGDREKFLEAGMDDYLAKPVKMEDLEKVLERVVSKEKA
jgi:PAS domain S-box-containing protein